MKKTKFLALFLFVFLFSAILTVSSFAAPDETDAYLQQYIFGTKNFYHMRAFNDRKSTGDVTVASSYSEVSGRTDVTVVYPGSSLGRDLAGYYVAKCGTCIDGEEMCYITPSLYGANLGVVSIWLEIPNDANEIPLDYEFNPYSVNFYFSNAYEDWFYYAGSCVKSGRQYFVYYKFFYTTTKYDRLAYHNIAMQFYSNFDLPSFYVYTGLEYFNIEVDNENLMGSLHGLMVPGAVYGNSCLKSPPSAHLTEVENGYLLGLSASDKVDEIYNEGVSVGKQVGYSNGYDVGFSFGEVWGYQNGEKVGYDNGYKEGYDNGYKTGGDINGVSIALKEAIQNNGQQIADALDGESDGTVVEGFLAGMWNGMTNFMQTLLSGITLSGLSLMNIVATFLAILMAAYVIKLTRG